MALCYPLDVIRQKQQVTANKQQLGFFDVIRHELQSSAKGWRAFYRGLRPTLVAIGVSSLMYFYIYNLLKRLAVPRGQPLPVAANLVVAYSAGLLNAIFTSPLWVVSHRCKNGGSGGLGMLTLLLRMMHQEGPSVLFAGLTSSIFLCSNPAIQFTVYERLRLQVLTAGSNALTPSIGFGLGLFSKAVATVATYPLQVLQSVTREPNSEGLWEESMTILEKQGIAGFFQGLCVKLLQTSTNAALMFMCYEQLLTVAARLLRFLQKKFSARNRAGMASGLTCLLLLNSLREIMGQRFDQSQNKGSKRSCGVM